MTVQRASESRSTACLKAAYVCILFALILSVALASFVRDRGQLLSNVSLWLFIVPFVLGIINTSAGLLAATALLTLSPSLHEQLNALGGMKLHAWSYPGVDSILGFLAAWFAKERIEGIRALIGRVPGGPLLLHGWIAISALIAVGRNLWQSASELSLRGLAYNVWLVRGISWHDDYYPLQDAYFYSVALALFVSVWAQLAREGRGLLVRLVATVICGASINAVFAIWQKATGNGWVSGDFARNVNAFWPDLHSFGAFMALALFLGFGALYTCTLKRESKITVGVGLLAAMIGLFLSGSRSTFLIMGFMMIGGCLWGAAKLRGRRRATLAVAAIVLLVGMGWALDRGYRGVSYDSISAQLRIVDFNSLNVVLKQRPEMWWASLRMYAAFPLFGLGQGTFYRLSAIPAFSGSEELVSMGGGGVHNYFLQTFVELGPVALAIALLFLLPCLRLGRQNFRLISFYALVGIAVGNIYAHSLLVRETLMLCAIFAGSYLWEARSLGDACWRPLGPVATRYSAIALASFSIVAIVEVMLSFNRLPFTYGQRCFQAQPLEKDGWTSGVLRVSVPTGATSVEVEVLADRANLARRPLDLKLSVLNESGLSLSATEYTFTDDEPARKLLVRLPEALGATRFIELKSSHCYVPLNLGITYDPRRLGVRVTKLDFRIAAEGR